MKINDKVKFSVPYLGSELKYTGTVVDMNSEFVTVEYYEPLYHMRLKTQVNIRDIGELTIIKNKKP